MKKVAALLFLCLITHTASAEEKGTPMSHSWSLNDTCTSVALTRTDRKATEQAAPQTIQIDDPSYVKALVGRILTIPADGKEFISTMPAETITMKFQCGTEQKTIGFYNGRLKTPSTGYNTDKAVIDKEHALHQDILSLFLPKFAAKLPKVAGHSYSLPAFTMTFTGVERFDHAPITVSGQRDLFLVKHEGEAEQILKITSGQTTPQPQDFVVGGKTYTLYTFKTKSGESLYPDYFQIVPRT